MNRILATRGSLRAVPVLLLGLIVSPVLAAPAVTVDVRDLYVRLQRMERDLRDLQAETFRRPPGGPQSSTPAFAGPAQANGAPDLNPIMRRMDEFSDSITRLTGQMEELGHQVDLLSQKADRLQKEMDYQAQAAGGAGASAPADDFGARPPGDAVASLAPSAPSSLRAAPQPAPGPQRLGQIPADARLPAPRAAGGSNPSAEYDSAMTLLSRAQYAPASQAFRSFVNTYPEDERAPAALFWAGDIAYSATKDYEEAARDFAELLKKYPMAPKAPEGMLKLGLSLLELNSTKEGCAALAALPAKYPNAAPAIASRARNERRDAKCR